MEVEIFGDSTDRKTLVPARLVVSTHWGLEEVTEAENFSSDGLNKIARFK
jgi:uncharacterized protein (DUF927 family)